MLEQLFALMAEKKASDLYLSAGAPISIKLQGVMVPINQGQLLNAEVIKNLLIDVLRPEQVATLEHEHELNIGIHRGEIGSFRLSAFMQKGNISAVFRYILSAPPSLDQLNLPKSLTALIGEKRGLILVCGATGAGKSSTLAALIEHRNMTQAGHILTIEDPIEFVFKHKKSIVNQREVGSDAKDLYTALKNGLRQAPDVILIGEIRDAETMTMALSYALSGHLVISTLHANNSYHALNRIVSMYPAENRDSLMSDMSTALKAIICQRLVRAKTGGRVPAVEVLMNTQLIAELLAQGKLHDVKEAMEKSLTKETITFEQSLISLVNQDLVEKKDALAAADSATNLTWLMNNQAAAKAEEIIEPPRRDAGAAEYKEFSFNQ